MKKLLITLLCVPLLALASGPELHLDKAPDKAGDKAALQNGAKLFVNYCLNCHSASYMRYNRLQDIGLTDQQIKDNLLFTAEKVGEPMRIAMQRDDAKIWFGAAPPDLTVIARARASEFGSGADWLYTYLRTFYRDPARPSGWNNKVFENVGMPHVLWELQGEQVMGEDHKLTLEKTGKLKPEEYDAAVADLVAYLQYMGEPVGEFRKKLGVIVLIALAALFVLTYALKREYWKDIH
ncbi:cytochrome c1 [Denitratisoma oestradiolicum]|uniref:Ammonia monooxygenase gamma subunit n=1 Tax=Denitratisoma oestradiolicum TaxID=311182 RepID=A0A6S6XZZ5_9PROT|nr:cytochrome c1 [Denitratisoma oestradiolicum]TWO81313.1 cytochrome c1 [Denitratisoma oestradiolicum]CAB1368499.1 Ammonia monooxygenase gamma subunit [Denitratisoma oestradiolicum]